MQQQLLFRSPEPRAMGSLRQDFCYFWLFSGVMLWGIIGWHPLFDPDEGRYAEIAREMLVSGDYLTPTLNGLYFFDKPILGYWLLTLSFELFGIHDWVARLVPGISAWLCVLWFYWVVAHVYDRRTAWVSGTLLTLTPLYFSAARYVNMDMLVAAWLSMSMSSLWWCTHLPAGVRRDRVLTSAYLFAALATLSKGLIGMVFPAAISILWWWSQRRWLGVLSWFQWRGLLLFLSLVLPWFVMMMWHHPAFFDYFFVYQHVGRYLQHGFNNVVPVWFYLPVILLGCFPWSFFLGPALYRWCCICRDGLVERFVLIWAVFVLLFFSWPPSKIIGYILPVLPPLAIILGRCWSLWWFEPLSRSVSWCLLLAAGSANGLLLGAYRWIPDGFWEPMTIAYTVWLWLLPWLAYRKAHAYGLRSALVYWGLWCVGLLLWMLSLAPQVVPLSSRSLVEAVKPHWDRYERVVIFHRYCYDFVFYSGRLPQVVGIWDDSRPIHDNFRHHFIWASQHQDASDVLITEADLQLAWAGRPLLLLITHSHWSEAKAWLQRQQLHYRVVATRPGLYLLTQDHHPWR